MRALMSSRSSFLCLFAGLAALALASTACGKEIGDSCLISSDCDPNNTSGAICDLTQHDGYCTIIGCDYDTCPDNSVCVAFFVGRFENKPCDPVTEDLPSSDGTDACNLDEICALIGNCVPRSAEKRYCMATCGGSGDCRDQYECRDETLMKEHGGEPVLAPGDQPTSDNLTSFCAPAPTSTAN
jgi:hypothetical protein